MGEVSSPGYTFIQKVNNSNIQIWVKFYSGQPAGFSFVLDSTMSYIYYLLIDPTTTKLISVNTSDGSLNTAIYESSNTLRCENSSCRIVISNSGKVYMSLTNGSTGFICKYINGDSQISSIRINLLQYAHSMQWISAQNIFIISINSSSTSIEFKLINWENPSITWKNSMTCSTSCSAFIQQSDLNEDKSIVYTSSSVDSYIYIVGFHLSDGSVAGQRYVSTSTTNHGPFCLKLNYSKLLIVTELQGTKYLTTINVSKNNVKSFVFSSGINIYSIDYEQKTQRLVFAGGKSADTYTYIAKSLYLTIVELSDLSKASDVFVKTTQTDKQINFNSGMSSITFGPNYSVVAFVPSSTDISINLSSESNYTSDVSYWLDDIYVYNLISNTQNNVSANLICSTSGLTSITYSFSSDYGNSIPSWGSIDSVNNILIFTPPVINTDTTYNFTIESYVPGNIKSYAINVIIQVDSCQVINCEVCVSGNKSKCSKCKLGYKVYSVDSSCIISEPSASAEAATIASQTTISTGIAASAATSLVSLTSPQGVWVTINQFQLLFILLLSGAFFPEDIVYYLTGMDFASFSFNFIPIKKGPVANCITNLLSFDLDNDYLSAIGLNSGSAIINNLSLISFILVILSFHMIYKVTFFIILKKFILKHSWLIKIKNFLYKFFTLKVYLRTLIESNQFLLICCIYEINLMGRSTVSRNFSLTFAFLIYFLCIKFSIIICFVTAKAMKSTQSKLLDYFEEVFDGMRNSKLAKCQTIINIFRTSFLVTFFLFGYNVWIITKIITLIIFQTLYLGFQIFARPIEQLKERILSLINEVLFLCLSITIIKFNNVSSWTSSAKYGFIWSITAINLLACVLYIVFLIKALFVKVMKCKKNRTDNYRSHQNENHSQYNQSHDQNSRNNNNQDENGASSAININHHSSRLVIIDFAAPENTIIEDPKLEELSRNCQNDKEESKGNAIETDQQINIDSDGIESYNISEL